MIKPADGNTTYNANLNWYDKNNTPEVLNEIDLWLVQDKCIFKNNLLIDLIDTSTQIVNRDNQ